MKSAASLADYPILAIYADPFIGIEQGLYESLLLQRVSQATFPFLVSQDSTINLRAMGIHPYTSGGISRVSDHHAYLQSTCGAPSTGAAITVGFRTLLVPLITETQSNLPFACRKKSPPVCARRHRLCDFSIRTHSTRPCTHCYQCYANPKALPRINDTVEKDAQK